MTIEEMRKEMRREVVPEEVVPQNVINCLIDEEAEPPKPDAFSFLTRLRALGIGSGDFLNLLEGCDAPESVVNKIKQNPAMNLQGLIMTLENSELTPDDYTRMLLTARQVWERTLTMRLEKSEKISREVDISDEADDAPVKVYGESDDDDQAETETEYAEEEDASDEYADYDEDLLDMSFTAILDKITAETLGEAPAETDSETETEPQSGNEEELPEENADNTADNSGDTELSFTAAFDKIKSEKHIPSSGGGLTAETPVKAGKSETGAVAAADTGEVPDSTALVEIDGELLRENFGKLSASSYSGGAADENTGEAFEKTEDRPVKTARQKMPKRAEVSSEETEEHEAPEKDEDKPVKTAKQKMSKKAERSYDEPDGEDENSEGEGSDHVYHTGAIIGATVGAAMLIGAGFYIGNHVGGKGAEGLHYAADNHEVFDKIYNAYIVESYPGGELAVGFEEDHHAIFGDLLISGEDGEKGVSSFSIGAGLYSLTEEAISVSIVENGTVTPLEDLLPPESSRFVAAFDNSGELYALFSGKQSGYMKITDGAAQYTVLQDGMLTSCELSGGEIKLGTVYTPVFRYTFTINDEDVYLPKLGTGEPRRIPADKVIISDTKGYSYGVSAGYSTADGSVTDTCAVIGDPIAASADGRFALNGDNGVLIKTDGDKITSAKTEKLTHAAFGESGCAITVEGDSENVKLYDAELEPASILTGVTDKINVMRFDGSFLTISCTNSVFRVDCSDAGKPEPLKLKTVNGLIAGQSALTCETNGTALLITRYDLKNSKAERAGEYAKELTAAQLTTAKLGAPKTAVIDGAVSGVAYSYFDGVSVISEYVVFSDSEQPKTVSVFDDKTGFTAAFKDGSAVNAVCAGGVRVLQ